MFSDSSLSKTKFADEIEKLDKLSLLKTRTFEEKEVRFYPVIKP
jgi:hypothetical protein